MRGSRAACTAASIASLDESSHTTIAILQHTCARALPSASLKKRSLYAGMRIETLSASLSTASSTGRTSRPCGSSEKAFSLNDIELLGRRGGQVALPHCLIRAFEIRGKAAAV